MKLLLLVQDEQRIILDRFYEEIASQFDDATIMRLSSEEQADLKGYFEQYIKCDEYDRIVLFLRFKKEIRQVAFLRAIPNLVFLEHDAYQNYSKSKYKGVFSRHYKKIPWVRVLSSGFTVSRKLQAEGIDALFVPKCYDDAVIKNYHQARDIELGFIGSIKNKTYTQRKEFLEKLSTEEPLLITRTNSGDDYVATLNRVKFFVSADIGMGEYMIKNFEAMAAGCVVLAWDQGEEENNALGFKDMENIVLYRSLDELRNKLHNLREDDEKVQKIAANGQQLAEQRYTYTSTASQLAKALIPPLRVPCKKRVLFFHRYSYS
ncbi:glycosyltransferase [uncultured Endozoicomonas sp.]|uniref:glycosyltransferase family protein n=1 Tax=uncultured Endozoicomonas sp. TaxID=432652 RepID=UPI00262EA996|nr:glycosyltransferase [uncultured Endozoicomonas sp.]